MSVTLTAAPFGLSWTRVLGRKKRQHCEDEQRRHDQLQELALQPHSTLTIVPALNLENEAF
jgi:hypothetical protein